MEVVGPHEHCQVWGEKFGPLDRKIKGLDPSKPICRDCFKFMVILSAYKIKNFPCPFKSRSLPLLPSETSLDFIFRLGSDLDF